MTAFALLVLSLALVCSPSGSSPGQTSDRSSAHGTHTYTTYAHTDVQGTMPTTNIYTHNNNHVNSIYRETYRNDLEKVYAEKELNNNVQFNELKMNNEKTEVVYDELYINIDDNSVKSNKEVNSIKDNKRIIEIDNNNSTIEAINRSNNDMIFDKEKNNETYIEVNNNYNKSVYNKPEYESVNFVNRHDNRHDEVDVKNAANKYLFIGENKTRHFEPREAYKLRTHRNAPLMHFYKNGIRVKRQDVTLIEENKCDKFTYNEKTKKIQHPHNTTAKETNYYSNLECTTVIKANEGQVIRLTFVDVFHIEEHPTCQYDYLEIRDGRFGYAKSLGRYCGAVFPAPLASSGPYLWLKFQSDETIEYEGFTIKVEIVDAVSHSIPEACYMELSGPSGEFGTHTIDPACKEKSSGHALDALWTITVDPDKYIYLNFNTYELAQPNECEMNLIQVFGAVLEEEKELGHYCGSVANSVNTKLSDPKQQESGNIMYVHLLAATSAIDGTKFNATFTAFRSLDPGKDEQCKDESEEFNCEDNTCIAAKLRCDGYAHCRLKADEDVELCAHHTESTLSEFHVLVILVIFSLILSAMSFVFLFKCIRKLYQDHKIIREHIRQSCEDRLDDVFADSRFTLDAKRLQRSSEPRASLERDNHTNELFKQQRSMSQHRRTSIDSDFQETRLDLDEEPWRREVETVPEPQDLKLERNGRSRRDTSKKEESIRSRKQSVDEKKEIKDAAVGVPDTKEEACQTRESLFDAPSSDSSNSASNSRAFSTFGYSGGTVIRPSPPAPEPDPAPKLYSTQIELLRQIPSYEEPRTHILVRRPHSLETTRSAPDVIIVSKPFG